MLYNLDNINSIKDILVEIKKTLSVAESVTSGHLQAALSAASDASFFFQGGITAYNAGQKTRQLNLEPIYAKEENCVSERIAGEMAVNVNKMFLSHYGIGITGYATVMPESDINDVYAYFAIASRDEVLFSKKISSSKTDSIEVQLDFTNQVCAEFNSLLKNAR
ncbi:MAG: CinA family protein [Chitinophagaceae bacterium]